MRLIDADAYLESVRPKGISEDVWKESEIYKSITNFPSAQQWIPCPVACDNFDCKRNVDGICKAEIIKLEYDMGQYRVMECRILKSMT